MRLADDWLLTPHRFAVHLATATAVIADMHLGYVSARRLDGEAVPHFGEQERLEQLTDALRELDLRALVIAGDAVESARGGTDSLSSWAMTLGELNIEVHLVPGNHDMHLAHIPGIQVHPQGLNLGRWRVVHDAPLTASHLLVHGHLHPCLRSGRVAGEACCYLHTATRLLLPAWCEHAAGVNVLGMRNWGHAHCSAIVGDQVVSVGTVETLRKTLSRRSRPFRIGFGLTQ